MGDQAKESDIGILSVPFFHKVGGGKTFQTEREKGSTRENLDTPSIRLLIF